MKSENNIQKILIVGGGIGGLSSGIALRKLGLDVTIVEIHDLAEKTPVAFKRGGSGGGFKKGAFTKAPVTPKKGSFKKSTIEKAPAIAKKAPLKKRAVKAKK